MQPRHVPTRFPPTSSTALAALRGGLPAHRAPRTRSAAQFRHHLHGRPATTTSACFGSKRIKTPNLDRMAAEGAPHQFLFRRARVHAVARGLLTGCYPQRIGLAAIPATKAI